MVGFYFGGGQWCYCGGFILFLFLCVCVCVCACACVFYLVVTWTYLSFTACLWLKKENLSGEAISPFEERSFPVRFQVNRSHWERWCMGGRSWWSSLPSALSVLWGNDGWWTTRCTGFTTHSVTHFYEVVMVGEQQDVLASPHTLSLLWGNDGRWTTRCTGFTTLSVTHSYEVMMDGEQQDVLASPHSLSLLWGNDGWWTTRCTGFTTHSVTHFYEVMMVGEQDVLASPHTPSLTSMR